MPTVTFVNYPHISITDPPLKILRPKIKKAYLANAIVETTALGSQEQKITFSKTSTGTLGSELYVIVETEDFQGYKVSINVKQGKANGLEAQDAAIMLKDDQGPVPCTDYYLGRGYVRYRFCKVTTFCLT